MIQVYLAVVMYAVIIVTMFWAALVAVMARGNWSFDWFRVNVFFLMSQFCVLFWVTIYFAIRYGLICLFHL